MYQSSVFFFILFSTFFLIHRCITMQYLLSLWAYKWTQQNSFNVRCAHMLDEHAYAGEMVDSNENLNLRIEKVKWVHKNTIILRTTREGERRKLLDGRWSPANHGKFSFNQSPVSKNLQGIERCRKVPRYNYISHLKFVCSACVCALPSFLPHAPMCLEFRICIMHSNPGKAKGAKRSWCDKVYFPHIPILPLSWVSFSFSLRRAFLVSIAHSLIKHTFHTLFVHGVYHARRYHNTSLYCSHWLFKKFKFKWYSICWTSIITVSGKVEQIIHIDVPIHTCII